MRLSSTASQQLAGLSFLDDPGPEVEGEHGRRVPLLLVELVGLGLPLADGQWLGLVPGDLPRRRLDVEEDGLLGDTVVVLGADDELAAIAHFHSVDDEGVIVTDVPTSQFRVLLSDSSE